MRAVEHETIINTGGSEKLMYHMAAEIAFLRPLRSVNAPAETSLRSPVAPLANGNSILKSLELASYVASYIRMLSPGGNARIQAHQ